MNLSDIKSFDTEGKWEYDTAHRELSKLEQEKPCTCQHNGRERILKDSPSMVGYPSLLEKEDLDPDCELHFPWMIEDEDMRKLAVRWWFAGYQVGYDTGYETGHDMIGEGE
jgi:hypothetical protein